MVLPSTNDLPQAFGRYELLSVLGEGGMARVYLATKSGPGGFKTESALKVVKRRAGRRSEFVQLLTREAIIGGQLRHPNIVATQDFDQVDGHYYIDMEYVEGKTLEDLLRAAWRGKNGRPPRGFPPILALDIARQLCRGLGYAHAMADRSGKPLNIIHRDIKPGNIMISTHGIAKITDFGIAKAAVETGVVTATNVVRGTPLYMSPEQATGQPLDHRSDLFSLGLIFYEMLTGKRLFEMKDIVSTMESIARAEIGDAPERLDVIVPGLGPVFRRLMSLSPSSRHPDGDSLGSQLAELSNRLADLHDLDIDKAAMASLRGLSTDAESQPVKKSPAPTLEDSEPVRADISLASLDRIDASNISSYLPKPHAEEEDPDTAETLPYVDPVIRRTALNLSAVLDEGTEAPPADSTDAP
ncbi:MAG: serine/threonine protein kinase [Deltaproteobacteria bacterium]|nr:serine/threonine protein kinase [Deltaproteobacteria bacterium]